MTAYKYITETSRIRRVNILVVSFFFYAAGRNFDSFIAILGMFGSSNNHFRISISNLKPRKAFSLKCLLPGNVVADLNIKLLVASLSNKVDFLLIELADINII